MAYCVPNGIPHSEFRSWDEHDQEKALAWQLRESDRCGACGTLGSDWEDDDFAYVGHVRQCPGCEIIERERDQVREGERGVHVGLVRNPVPPDER